MSNTDTILWQPSLERVQNSAMQSLIESTANVSNYQELHHWSVKYPVNFWQKVITDFSVKYTGNLEMDVSGLSFKSYKWFPNVRLNFAENLLKNGKDRDIALNFVHESGLSSKTTYEELRSEVGALQAHIKPYIGKGDVLACYMPNIPQTCVSMLATTACGGVFTSTSSDFGVEGVLDRFGQSLPKVLVAAVGYEYGGKYFDQLAKIKEIASKIQSIEKVILVDFLNKGSDSEVTSKSISWEEATSVKNDISYTEMAFSDPVYIMYSSGTTGKPKCIVHSIGGTLLQHIKELGLHTDLTSSKTIMYFTTCGWMMWNWLVSSLYFGTEVVLYEGSPGHPSLPGFVDIINREKINIFGTSPKFLKALQDNLESTGCQLSSFPSLETILSTGAPLIAEQYDFVYDQIKKDVLLCSISGGTDIIGCFMLGNPLLPVKRGQIQCLGLGMDVACFDDTGKAIYESEGELVCRQSFPSQPIYFLNDPSRERFNNAYFSRFPGVWHHGDFITINEDNSVEVFGRSDATLNPGGVRIGTAEIYRQTESMDFISDSVCVGKQVNGDVEVLLFVKLLEGINLSDEIKGQIKKEIRSNTTPRHVPKEIYQVQDIPYTRSGKKMEMVISKIVNGKVITNKEAIANPECLSEYEKLVK